MRFIPRQAPAEPAALEALRPYEGVVARLLHARGVRTAQQAEDFLHPNLSMLHDPLLMQGMAEALQILEKAKADNTPTVVYGDYDVDDDNDWDMQEQFPTTADEAFVTSGRKAH
ncbi:MAG: hypothetical protein J6K73_08220, partial [Clostridia bacterium]|nr:hypothetical protein [Clostridia bacterium]